MNSYQFEIIAEASADYTSGPTFERLKAEREAAAEAAKDDDQGAEPSTDEGQK